jgi:multicomponent Na+:H+ antiporter subunit B
MKDARDSREIHAAGTAVTGIALALFAGLLLWAARQLPDLGDPHAPANRHVAPEYLERSYHDTHTPNVVTSVLADYRGYDTLGETTVIFTAGIATFLLLRRRRKSDDS